MCVNPIFRGVFVDPQGVQTHKSLMELNYICMGPRVFLRTPENLLLYGLIFPLSIPAEGILNVQRGY